MRDSKKNSIESFEVTLKSLKKLLTSFGGGQPSVSGNSNESPSKENSQSHSDSLELQDEPIKGEDNSGNDAYDRIEASRESMLNCIIKYVWQGNFSSPDIEEKLKRGARVLDVGCGAGSWVLDMSTIYPNSTFIGIDMSSCIFPTKNSPPNVGFLKCNILDVDGIPFPDETFDFVYQRFLWSSLIEHQWVAVIHDLARVTKRGGALELMELDNMPGENAGTITNFLFNFLNDQFRSKGANSYITLKIQKMLEDNGMLTNINHDDRMVPLGGWGGKLGDMMLKHAIQGFKPLKPAIMRMTGKSSEECDGVLRGFERECEEYKLYIRQHRFWCKKLES